MVEILIKMKHFSQVIIILAIAMLSNSLLFAQDMRFEWRGSRVAMDSTLNYPEEPKVRAIISKYKPSLDV